ncbi:MAG: MerR family DNA-binding transcriptional regulator [Actinobacteria bacterium]|nr:MerR family DNA-binding transcriptional regulator [Actinomycetota bacterium]MCB9390223.1 MerR family DNA-binding transcriptional regulator [Acidimicrobiia bacterium]
MYSIGDMARLAGVTPRTLRHYHDLGVLVPADVNDTTGYRRYDVTQLANLFQLLALKAAGLRSLTLNASLTRGSARRNCAGCWCCAAPNSRTSSTKPHRGSNESKPTSNDWRIR